jgi:hypothetical protein
LNINKILKGMKNTIRNRLKEDIIAVLQESSNGVDDGFGGTICGVWDDSFDDAAEGIIKMIETSYEVNNTRVGNCMSGDSR